MDSISSLLFAIILALSWFLQPDSTTFIKPDSPLTLRLDGRSPAVVLYEAQAGDVITVSARALPSADVALLDTVIEVLTPARARVAYNDDHFGSFSAGELAATDSAIVALLLDEAGTYTIRINSFNGVSAGEIEVTLMQVDAIPATVAPREGVQIVTLDLPANAVFRYALAATPVTIAVRDPRGALDPVIVVYGADGAVVAQTDDHDQTDLALNIFDAKVRIERGASVEVREFLGRPGRLEIIVSATP